MNMHEAWREIRGTAAEKVLLNAHAAGEACRRSVYGAGLSESSAAEGAQKLRDMGLAVREVSLAGELELTDLGVETAERAVRSRHDGPDRWDAVQRAMLRFVLEKSPGRAFEVVSEPVDERPVTEDEAELASDYLITHGLLRAFSTDQADDIHPTVTTKGRYAIHEPNIREYVERGFVSVANDYSTNTTVSGGTVAAVTGGTGNTTNVTQTISADERTQILTLVDQVLEGLPESSEDTALRSEMQELKTEAASPTASKTGLLARARDALVLATATEGGRSVIQWIGQIVTGLGG